MLRILANENVPAPVIRGLRALGHEVASLAEDSPGASDRAVVERAQSEHRLVVTFDLDFGELAFRWRLPAQCGIVIFRLTGADPSADNQRAIGAMQSRGDWTGQLSIVEDDRVRTRALPPSH